MEFIGAGDADAGALDGVEEGGSGASQVRRAGELKWVDLDVGHADLAEADTQLLADPGGDACAQSGRQSSRLCRAVPQSVRLTRAAIARQATPTTAADPVA